MNLFNVHAEKAQEKELGPRIWFVIAGNVFDAISLVPDGFSVKAVDVHPAAVQGPDRVIGWMGESTIPFRASPAESRSDADRQSLAVCAAHERTKPWNGCQQTGS